MASVGQPITPHGPTSSYRLPPGRSTLAPAHVAETPARTAAPLSLAPAYPASPARRLQRSHRPREPSSPYSTLGSPPGTDPPRTGQSRGHHPVLRGSRHSLPTRPLTSSETPLVHFDTLSGQHSLKTWHTPDFAAEEPPPIDAQCSGLIPATTIRPRSHRSLTGSIATSSRTKVRSGDALPITEKRLRHRLQGPLTAYSLHVRPATSHPHSPVATVGAPHDRSDALGAR